MLPNLTTLSLLLNGSVLASRKSLEYGFAWQDYVSMVITSFGIVTNIVNIFVFMSSQLKDLTYKYMLAKSIINCVYLLLSFLNVFFIYCSYCPVTFSYLSNLYAIWISFYIIGCLGIARILIEIALSLRIMFILKNRTWLNGVSHQIIIVGIVVFSLGFFAYKPFGFLIQYIPEFNIYYLVYTNFGQSRTNSLLSIIQQTFRIILGVGVVTIINIINLVRFRKRFKDRRVANSRNQCLPTQENSVNINRLSGNCISNNPRCEKFLIYF